MSEIVSTGTTPLVRKGFLLFLAIFLVLLLLYAILPYIIAHDKRKSGVWDPDRLRRKEKERQEMIEREREERSTTLK